MKYCAKCKCNVHEQLDNCPVCGSYVNDNEVVTALPMYEKMESAVHYPVFTQEEVKPKPKALVNLLLFLAGLLCIPINLVTNKENLWFVYVLYGVIAAILCVISPIFDKKKIYLQISLDILIVSGGFLLFDFMESGKFVPLHGWSVQYVIPSIILACIICIDFMIIFRGKREKGYLITSFYVNTVALVPQIVLWAIRWQGATWFCTALFFGAIANSIVLSVILHKTIREEFNKKFNL